MYRLSCLFHHNFFFWEQYDDDIPLVRLWKCFAALYYVTFIPVTWSLVTSGTWCLCSGALFLCFVLLQRSHEVTFLLVGLEATMAELAACVDELEVDFLQGLPLGVNQQRLKRLNKIWIRTSALKKSTIYLTSTIF